MYHENIQRKKGRICPSETVLAEYLSGLLSEEDRSDIEAHLAECGTCRTLLLEAHKVIKGPDPWHLKRLLGHHLRKNVWIIAAVLFFAFSFIFRAYFFQFLALTVIFAAKWIMDSRNTKLLITIHEAWKRGDKQKADNILSKFDPEN